MRGIIYAGITVLTTASYAGDPAQTDDDPRSTFCRCAIPPQPPVSCIDCAKPPSGPGGPPVGGSAQFGKDQDAPNVSLADLIAAPEKYANWMIRTQGAFRIEFEGNALCLTPDDLERRVTKNCLWIDLDEKVLQASAQQVAALNGEFVRLEGIFRVNEHGHMSMNPGAISNIWWVVSLKGAK